MRKPLIVGNWKMNTLRADAEQLTGAAVMAATHHEGGVDVGIAPPALWLSACVGGAGHLLSVFGQNAHQAESGAFTGEVSAPMLADAGADGVILGHSERRHVFGETDAVIADKVVAALEAGLRVILCVGETLEQRDAQQTTEIVLGQAAAALGHVSSLEHLVIAYEPVWAIGTGRTATPEQAQEVHASLRHWIDQRYGAAAAATTRIQYGGSVKPTNASELLAMPDIDGALVGGASLDATSFSGIIEAAAR